MNSAYLFSYTMFTGREWQHLAEATGMPFRHVVPMRDAWDSNWKAIFERLLNCKVISEVD
jgi:hypothetical protein